MFRYYTRLVWDAVWKSAGTFSRVVTIGLLATTSASVVVPMGTAITLPTATTTVGVLLVLGLMMWEVLVTNYKRVEGLQQQVQAFTAAKPRFEFGFSQQVIPTPERNRPEFRQDATWFRVRVRNHGGLAHNCVLSLESAAGQNEVVPGALAVTGVGSAARDIAPEGVANFDLGYCFHTDWAAGIHRPPCRWQRGQQRKVRPFDTACRSP